MTTPAKNKNETFRTLRVLFTDPQRLELGIQLAEARNETTQIESDFQRVKDEFKSKLSAVDARVTDLSNKVSSGYEMKEVKCAWVMDYPKPGKKTLVRLDLNNLGAVLPAADLVGMKDHVVETADMTEAEKTPELNLGLDNPVLPAGAGISHDGTVKVASDGPAEPAEGKK
jgi:hypothetical protein